MKKIIALFIPLLIAKISYAQKVYQIRADSVRIYNVCDTAELILENRTQGVNGYLYNKGAGRTEFRKIQLKKIGTSQIAIVGQDTLDLNTLPGIGGIDTAYREGDYIKYLKRSNLYAIYAPLPDFKVVPNGAETPFSDFKGDAITGFFAYNSPDMPPISDQAQINPGTGKQFYVGHAVKSAAIGYQMAVNWDGETLGPKGAFLRIKDDTNTAGWGAWRELLFKDYADSKYALTNSSQDDLHAVLSRGNQSTNRMLINAIRDPGPPTISLAVGDYDSGINSERDGILTLRADGFEAARWMKSVFAVSDTLKVAGNIAWHQGNDQLLLRNRGEFDNSELDNLGGLNGTARIAYPDHFSSLLSFSNQGSTGTFQLLAGYTGSLQFRSKIDERIWSQWKTIWHDQNDGAGSGLDADLLDGYEQKTEPVNNTIVRRDNAGNISAQYFNTTAVTQPGFDITKVFASNDNYVRAVDATSIRKFIGLPDAGETLQSVTTRGNTTDKTLVAPGLQLSPSVTLVAPPISESYLSVNTPSGSLSIGCANQGWAHFFTSNPRFYFDKEIAVNGGFRIYSSNTVLDDKYLNFNEGHGNGIRFWNGSNDYKIFMSATNASGFPIPSISAQESDYNMYFRMNGLNRGFVFVTGDNQPKVQIDASGLTSGAWLRVRGDNGLFFEDHHGGFHMIDDSWIRTYNHVSFFVPNGSILRTDGELQVGTDGSKLRVPMGGIPTIDGNTIFHAGNLLYSVAANPDRLAQRDASGNLFASGFYQSSKASLKKNIADFNEAALPLLNKVQIKQFVYKDDTAENLHFGIIADSTDWHFSTRNQDKFDTNSSLAITMKAVQELSVQNKTLAEENEQLKNQVAELLKRMENLEKKISKD
ncbi:MAG: hypothetical protein JO154_21005 [Chitinophaga sp.]|uniref:tail fiber domain-containing protein n=1 Tax=Chitinophaga sp. TaxID=1869181 RepID=UPI0025B9C36A|nr:tail fiber domain-containing protein [Chitinophaga sp.]MBV8255094.1 hypothetical protein [Chitinophaga sp.]